MLKLEIGKRYVQRNGEVSPKLECIDHFSRHQMGAVPGGYWLIDGGYRVNAKSPHPFDLISEYHEPPAVDPLTGAARCDGVPMIEPGPRYKVGDRVCLTSTGECFEIFGAHFPDKGDEYCLQKPGGPIGWRKAEHIRHAPTDHTTPGICLEVGKRYRKTMSDAVRQVLEDAFPEFRVDQGNTNAAIAQDYVLGRLMPLLEAAKEMNKYIDPPQWSHPGSPLAAAADQFTKARAALMWEGGMSKHFENCLSCNGKCGHWTDDGEWTECGACDGMGGHWVQAEESPRIGDDEEME